MKKNGILCGIKALSLVALLSLATPLGVYAAGSKDTDIDTTKMTEEEKEGYELTKKYEKTLLKNYPGSKIPKSYFKAQSGKSNKVRELPEKYDSNFDRSDGKDVISPVKDQDITGTCWCFSIMESAQARALSKYKDLNSADFSEYDLAYFIYNQKSDRLGLSKDSVVSLQEEPGSIDYYLYGGFQDEGMFAVAKTIPFSDEKDAKFTDLIDNVNNEGKATLPDSYAYNHNIFTSSGVEILDPNIQRDEVKSKIMEYGAGQIAYKHSTACFDFSTYAYFRSEELSEVQFGGHAVTVVGWDDNYSKDNFRYAPKEDGAWLIKNSWGDIWGNDGYFWMSYEEPTLSPVYFFDVEEAGSYDNVYQYDGSLSDVTIDGYLEGANVFTAQNDEKLNAVSFFTIKDKTDYKVSVYKNLSNPEDPTSGTLLTTKTGTVSHMGYTKLSLDKEYEINTGETFSVVVEQKADGKATPMYCDRFQNDDSYESRSVSAKGESFVSKNGDNWEDISADRGSNLRIKAFSKINESVSGEEVKFDEDAYEVVVDEKASTSVSIDGVAASGKAKLSYSVEDEEIASVDSLGNLYGKMPGKTKVTVSYGEKTDTAEVEVVSGGYTSIKIYRDENYATKDNPLEIYVDKNFRLNFNVVPSSFSELVDYTIETEEGVLDPESDYNELSNGNFILFKEDDYKITAHIDGTGDLEGAEEEFYVSTKIHEIDCADDFEKISADPYEACSSILYRYNVSDAAGYKVTFDADIEAGFDSMLVLGMNEGDIPAKDIYEFLCNKDDTENSDIKVVDVLSGKIKDYTFKAPYPYLVFAFSSDYQLNGSFKVTDISTYIPLESIAVSSDDTSQSVLCGESIDIPVTLLPEGAEAEDLYVISDNDKIASATYEDGKLNIKGNKVGCTFIDVTLNPDDEEGQDSSEDIEEESTDNDEISEGKSIRIFVNVYSDEELPKDLAFTDGKGGVIKDLSIKRNDKFNIKFNSLVWNHYEVEYESSDNEIAFVDDDQIIASSTGEAVITATINVPVYDETGEPTDSIEYTAELQVEVTEPDTADIRNMQTLHNYVIGTDDIYTYTNNNKDVECMTLYFDARSEFADGDYVTIQDGNGYYYGLDVITGSIVKKKFKTESRLTDEYIFRSGEVLYENPFTVYDNTVKVHFVSKAGSGESYEDDYSDDYDSDEDYDEYEDEYEDEEPSIQSEYYGFKLKSVKAGKAATDIKVDDIELTFDTYKTSRKKPNVTLVPEDAVDVVYYEMDNSDAAYLDGYNVVCAKVSGESRLRVYTGNPEVVESYGTVTVGSKSLNEVRFFTLDDETLKGIPIEGDTVDLEVAVEGVAYIKYNKVPWNATEDVKLIYDEDEGIDVEQSYDEGGSIDIYGNEEGEYEVKVLDPSDNLLLTINVTVIEITDPDPEYEIPVQLKTFSDEVFFVDANDGKDPSEIEESDLRHLNYSDDEGVYWTVKREGAEYIDITFSKSSFVETYGDWVCIYDMDGNLIAALTGDQDMEGECAFAGKTIRIPGEGFILGFWSDEGGDVYDGFKVIDINPYISEDNDEPEITPTPVPTGEPEGNEPTVTPTPVPTDEPEGNEPKVGDTVKDASGKASYRILSDSAVAFTGVTAKNPTSAAIPDTVSIGNKKYSVTQIAPNAFKNKKKLKKVTIGKNVAKIGSKAFYGCKNLKTIIIKGKKLKSVGSGAIKGINKKAVIKAPKAKLKAYRKIFKKKTGFKKTMKIKKK